MALLPERVLQSHLCHTAVRNTAQKQISGPLLQLESRPCPSQGSDNLRARGGPRSISRAGSGHPNLSHSSYQGDNGQHTLRKEVADKHIKNSSSTKKY